MLVSSAGQRDDQSTSIYARMSPTHAADPPAGAAGEPTTSTHNSAAGGGGATGGFFTSNQQYPTSSYASASTSTATIPVTAPAPRSTQVFLPPLPPNRSTSGGGDRDHSGGGDHGRDLDFGATFLSDEETNASDSPVGSHPPQSGGGPRPRAARQNSVASSVDTTSGQTKGKGKARGSIDGGTAPKKKGGNGTKRKQQVGPDGKPLPKKKKAGRACAPCQKAHLTCDDGECFQLMGSRSRSLTERPCSSTLRPVRQEGMSGRLRGRRAEKGEIPARGTGRTYVRPPFAAGLSHRLRNGTNLQSLRRAGEDSCLLPALPRHQQASEAESSWTRVSSTVSAAS